MPVAHGSWVHAVGPTSPKWRDRLISLYIRFFGVVDLHAPLRYRAIRGYLTDAPLSVELGAGIGTMSVELARADSGKVLAVPFARSDASVLKTAIRRGMVPQAIEVMVADARSRVLKPSTVDQVLLVDVLEHIVEEDAVLAAVRQILKPEGRLVISVPTQHYPQIFGGAFDKEIGHVRHYDMNGLISALRRHGFEVLDWTYHTRGLSAAACAIWYNKLYGPSVGAQAARLLTLPLLKIVTRAERPSKALGRSRSFSACGLAACAVRRDSMPSDPSASKSKTGDSL